MIKRYTDLALSPPQMEYYQSEAKATAVVAGYRSGKTEVGMFRMVNTMFANVGCDMLYLAPTYSLIRDIWYPKVSAYLEQMGVGYFINQANHIIHLAGIGKIFCRSMEKPERIIGFEVLDALLDELDTLTVKKGIEVFERALARCSQIAPSGKRSQQYITTTPEGFKSVYKLFVKDGKEPSKRNLIQMTTYSNAHNLQEDYIETLLENYTPALVQAYVNGEFVNLTSGRVWTGYDRKLNHSSEVVQGDELLRVGMDFNVERGCASIEVVRDNLPIAVDEIVGTYDTPETIRTLREMYPRNPIIVYPDASGKSRRSVNATTSDMALLSEAGFMIRVNESNPYIKDRVTATNAMFCNAKGLRRFKVNANKCPHSVEGFEHQVYDKNGLPAKGAGKMDDITDSGTYPIAYEYPVVKNKLQRVRVGGV